MAPTLSVVSSVLLLFTSTAAAQAEELPRRQSCLVASERTAIARVADSAHEWITDLVGLQKIRSQTASGRGTIRLSIKDVVVDDVDEDGFWISANDSDCRLYVKPAEGNLIRVRRGEVVSVQGEIRYAGRRVTSSSKPQQQPYLYSYTVRPAWYPNSNGVAVPR